MGNEGPSAFKKGLRFVGSQRHLNYHFIVKHTSLRVTSFFVFYLLNQGFLGRGNFVGKTPWSEIN